MRKIRTCFLLVMLATAVSGNAQKVEVREETLGNGMKVLMVERHESPRITCGWVARAGSVNERPGITGISHLFEHMMFKGTPTIGIKDYQKGMEIQARQDEIRSRMEVEYRKLREKQRKGEISGNIYDPDHMTSEIKKLREELEALFAEEKEIIVKDEMDQIYTREGGARLNAFTTQDQTVYFVDIPANKLELWFWLESDRLLNPVFREFYSERDVVREERRLRVESTPTGRLNELFTSMFWQSSPYSWPVIGWASDVESITRRQAEDYFATYYAPNNLTAVLVGDFNPDQALEFAKLYFGRIPRGKEDPPEMITFEVDQVGEKRLEGEAETNPRVTTRFHAPSFNHLDSFAVQLLTDALRGRTGRLYKALVEEKKVAVGEPSATYNELKYGGYLDLSAEVKEGSTPAEVEAALLAEVEKLKEKALGQRELQKIKNQEMADSFRRLQSNFFLLVQLLIYDSNDHWSYINQAPLKMQEVSAEDIRKAAAKYLTAENRTVAIYRRKAGSTPEDPELSALPEQIKAMVKQQLAQIEELNDPEALQHGLSRFQQMRQQAPPQVQPAVDYLIKKIQERLDKVNAAAAPEEGGN